MLSVVFSLCAALQLTPSGQQRSRAEVIVHALMEEKIVCRLPPRERKPTLELIGYGRDALPPIEAALEALQTQGAGKNACGMPWLLFAFARLEGTQAYPRLRALLSRPDLRVRRRAIESAMAVSLDLTTVVSRLDDPGSTSSILGSDAPVGYVMPQDSLNRFLIGWLREDREAVEASLTPQAGDSFRKLLRDRSWSALRSELSRGHAQPFEEIGYRLALPEGMVEPAGIDVRFNLDEPHKKRLSGTADFYVGGTSCASHVLEFEDVADGSSKPDIKWRFVIGNADMASLLRSLGKCF